jgi:hypothetical protein
MGGHIQKQMIVRRAIKRPERGFEKQYRANGGLYTYLPIAFYSSELLPNCHRAQISLRSAFTKDRELGTEVVLAMNGWIALTSHDWSVVPAFMELDDLKITIWVYAERPRQF